jgi:uncharacterized membrane protein
MHLRRLSIIFLILYALLTAYTVVIILLGGMPSMFLTPLTTLAGSAFALCHAARREGWKGALILLALVFCVSLLFESVGVATGLVYGPYHYTDKLGAKFLGLVPYLIPVAWFMMSYPSFVIADRLVPSRWMPWQRILTVAAVGGMVMTAWDMIMDPVMVYNGHWVWDVNGAYHGIPLQNFWGWWLTVFTTYALYLLITGTKQKLVEPTSDLPVVASYLLTALGMIIPTLIRGSGELALIGTFSMFPWILAGWLKMQSSESFDR